MRKTLIVLLTLFLTFALYGCDYLSDGHIDNENNQNSSTYKITYNALNKDQQKIVQNYDDNQYSTYPTRPENEGYLFKGWYLDPNFNNKYTFGSLVEESFNLYAKWEEPTSEELLFEELFDLNSNIKIELDMDDSEFQKIQDDYDYYSNRGAKSPIYRYANSLTIYVNDQKYVFEEVGVRMKGNTSRTSFYNNEKGYYNQIHLKFNLQSTFDNINYYGEDTKVWEDSNLRKERKNRTFAGLEKLDIKWNKNFDQTYAKEKYALDFFKDEGIIAQNINTTKFSLTNNNRNINMGIFYLYEVIDENFIRRHMPEENLVGDLYKAGWMSVGANLTNNVSYGISDDDLGLEYNYDLKTNKKTSDNNSIKTLVSALNKNTNEDTLYKYLDVDYMLKFEAISYLTGNPDDIRNNYNNYYIYFRDDHKAIIIPYDYDRVFGIIRDYNPSGNGMMYVDILEKNAVGNNSNQQNPIYKIIINSNTLSNSLVDKVQELVENSKWFEYTHFENYYNVIKTKHESDVIPDIDFDNVENDRLYFDIDRTTENIHSVYTNIKMATYLSEKRKTVYGNN